MTNNGSFINNRTSLTKEAEALFSAINRFRCVRIEQLKYFMPPTKSTRPDYHEAICPLLSIKRLAYRSGDYMFATNDTTVSQQMIDSIWVMIDMLQKEDNASIAEELKNAFNIAHPCTISFIQDNYRIIKLLPVISESEIINLYAEDEKYSDMPREKKENNADRLLYVVIIRNEEMLDEIAKIAPCFPHKIALLTGEYNEKPVIEYYS